MDPTSPLVADSTRLGIESYSPIHVFLLIEYHTEDKRVHIFVVLFGFFLSFKMSHYLLLD